MSQKERLDSIIELLHKNGFVTVKFLTEELHYSTATINRDLNMLQNQQIVRRIYGGAELYKAKTIPLYFRYRKMRTEKNNIGKKAAEFINDGDTIFIDCSTTAQYIGKYITDRKDLTVITNNISLAAFLSEYKMTVICLGGQIMEPPSMIYSSETVESVRKYGADKLFFSAGAITKDGKIGRSNYDEHYLTVKAMMENSTQKYLLLDHEKITADCKKYLGDLNDTDTVITDFSFSDEVKNKYKNTEFVEI